MKRDSSYIHLGRPSGCCVQESGRVTRARLNPSKNVKATSTTAPFISSAICGTCVERCTNEFFAMVDDKARLEVLDECMVCRLCVTICPAMSIPVKE